MVVGGGGGSQRLLSLIPTTVLVVLLLGLWLLLGCDKNKMLRLNVQRFSILKDFPKVAAHEAVKQLKINPETNKRQHY